MHETWHTTLFGTYYGVEMVRIQNNSHLLEITCYVVFLWVFKFFGTFAHKVVQTWFVLHQTWHTTLFGIYYCVDLVRIQNSSSYVRNYVLSCYFMGF